MSRSNSQNRLEDAVATLINTQASFQANMLAIQARIEEIERHNAERFDQIVAMLQRHEQILQALPENVREKIGFQKER